MAKEYDIAITFPTFKDGDIENFSSSLGRSKYELNNIGWSKSFEVKVEVHIAPLFD
ncbi:hypothetical protein ['Paenibacillus yunnanensis' Narsing Rao et al. 2020]|uniref:hypothetical protein n=1 Tax=Paenibacillus tengchongensis TaxID=2608684 RepID=UPI00165202F5|nr:hypothetical protein [Paenibacillus tengchongensis]